MYLLDANVFIEAKNRYYDFDVCPAFWDWLVDANQRGVVGSASAVFDELAAADDPLANWAGDHRTFFEDVDAEIVRSISAANAWATASPDYDPAAKTQFAIVADSSLLGHAVAGGHTIVSHEVPSDSRKRIKLPNAAAAFDVPYTNPFVMLRKERARFVLGSV